MAPAILPDLLLAIGLLAFFYAVDFPKSALTVLLFLRAPERTVSRLQAVDGWLSRNGHTLLVAVVGLIGLWVFIDGLAGLLS